MQLAQKYLPLASILAIAVVFRFLWLDQIPNGLFNDEAVELNQSLHLPMDHFRLFAPSYPGGRVDWIEIIAPLISRPILLLNDGDFWPVKYLAAALSVVVVGLFYFFLCSFFSPHLALLGSFLMASSAYHSFFTRIITRNHFSSLWMLLIIWPFTLGVLKKNRTFIILSTIFLLIGVHTYTAFKIFSVAYYGVLCWYCWKNREGKILLLSIAIFALGTLGLGLLAQEPLKTLFLRGSYVFREGSFPLWGYWAQSLLLPIYVFPIYRSGQLFLADPTHIIFSETGHGILSPIVAIFFYVGLINTILGREKNTALTLLGWMALCGLLVLGVGGPSLKTSFLLLPLILLMTIYGLDKAFFIIKKWKYYSGAMRGPLLLGILAAVLWNQGSLLFKQCRYSDVYFIQAQVPQKTALKAVTLEKIYDHVLVLGSRGLDTYHYYFRNSKNKIFYSYDYQEASIFNFLKLPGNNSILLASDMIQVKEYLSQKGFSYQSNPYYVNGAVVYDELSNFKLSH